MPSPLAHVAAGYLIYRAFRHAKEDTNSRKFGPIPGLLAATAALSMLPDADVVLGVLASDIGKYHNNLANSPAFATFVSLVVATVVWLVRRSGFKRWFAITLVSYLLHILMDYLTMGRGIMLGWPFVSDRFDSPFDLFFGLHWSEGLLAGSHLITVATEVAFIAGIAIVVKFLPRKKGNRPEMPSTGS